jgi:hypothetical protein
LENSRFHRCKLLFGLLLLLTVGGSRWLVPGGMPSPLVLKLLGESVGRSQARADGRLWPDLKITGKVL